MADPVTGTTEREKIVVFEVAVPAIYTADLANPDEFLAATKADFESESEWLLNCLGDVGGGCRLRLEVVGEKDGEVQEVWGDIRGARLVDAGPNDEPWKNPRLLRDEDSCEWCDCDLNEASRG